MRARPLQRPANPCDVRPAVHVIGLLLVALGLAMLVPAALDAWLAHANARAFALAAFLTVLGGLALAISTAQARTAGMTRQQAFLLTVMVWAVLPLFGALPFMLGAPQAGFTDAYFEAMSGLTTTGATVFAGLEEHPGGMLLWRAMLQWFGGVGIVVFAMVFLPMLKVGGMQFFRSEAFDLQTDVLPRAAQAAAELGWLYLAITLACVLAYEAAGMSAFDAVTHAMTTVSTGGLGTYDHSFAGFSPAAQYVAVLFMVLAALPFIQLVRAAQGRPGPILRDPQAQAFLGIVAFVSVSLTLWLVLEQGRPTEPAFRAALFNVTSVLTGTGYASEDYMQWGGFPIAFMFLVGMIGGCAGSTSCSAKVFRYQILGKAIWVQLRRIHAPSGVFPLRYDGRAVDHEVLSSVMGFFFVFVAAIALVAIGLTLLGLDPVTAISGSVAALCNIGPGLGEVIGPAGYYGTLPPEAKWLLSFAMLFGRLEFLSVLVLLTRGFWLR